MTQDQGPRFPRRVSSASFPIIPPAEDSRREERDLREAFRRSEMERLRAEVDSLRGEVAILRRQISGASETNPSYWSEDEERVASLFSGDGLVLSSVHFERLRDLNRRGLRDDEASRRVWRLARKAMRKRLIQPADISCRLAPPALQAMSAGTAENPSRPEVFAFMEGLIERVAEMQFGLSIEGDLVGSVSRANGAETLSVAWAQAFDKRRVLSLRQAARGEAEWTWPDLLAGHVALEANELRELLTLIVQAIEKAAQNEAESFRGKGENVRLAWAGDKNRRRLSIQQFTAGSAYEDWMGCRPAGEVSAAEGPELERFVSLLLQAVEKR
jgi:hypothetical protein